MEKEICEQIIEQSKSMPKEEKLTFLTQQIWHSLNECPIINDSVNSKTLMEFINEYLKTSFELEDVEINYIPLDGKFGVRTKDGIALNSDYFTFPGGLDNYSNNIEKLAQYIMTLSHELTHENDARANKNLENDPRFAKGNAYSLIMGNMSKINPEKEKMYTELAASLYFSSKNEVVARNVGCGSALQLISQLEKIILEQVTSNPELSNKCGIFFEAFNQGISQEVASEKANFTWQEYSVYIIGGDKLAKMKNHIETTQQTNDQLMATTNFIIKDNLQEAQQDFQEICDKFFDPSCFDDKISEFSFDIAYAMTKPEFYNKEIAQKLYDYCKAKGKPHELATLSEIEELDIPKKERKFNIETSERLIKEFEERQQAKLSSQSNQFHMN